MLSVIWPVIGVQVVRLLRYSERLVNTSSSNFIRRLPVYKKPAADMRKIITARIILHSIFEDFLSFQKYTENYKGFIKN
jgi:hypothetical protein